MRGWFAATATVAVALLVRSAAAQPDPATAQFDFGLAEMRAGRYDTACPALGESYRLDPRPGVLFTLAECEREWGKLATALGHYNAYLSNYTRMNANEQAAQADRQKIAAKQQKALREDVPELTITLGPDVPQGSHATRDGVLLDNAVIGVAVPVDPGDHRIKLQLPDGSSHEWTLTLAAHERRELMLSPPEKPKPQPPPPPQPAVHPVAIAPTPRVEESSGGLAGQKVAALVVGAIGLASIAGGSVAGGLALSENASAQNLCPNGFCPTQEGLDHASNAQLYAHVSTVTLAVGAVAVGVAIILFATSKSPSHHARLTPALTGVLATW